jgi:hypothetical protein
VPVGCEKLITATKRCEATSVGRCAACGDAMCESHRALPGNGVPIVDQCQACFNATLGKEQRKLAAHKAANRTSSDNSDDPPMTYEQLVEFLKRRNFPTYRLTSWPPALVAKALTEANKQQLSRTVSRLFRGSQTLYDMGWCLNHVTTYLDDRNSAGYWVVLRPDGIIVQRPDGRYPGYPGPETIEPARSIEPHELYRLREGRVG